MSGSVNGARNPELTSHTPPPLKHQGTSLVLFCQVYYFVYMSNEVAKAEGVELSEAMETTSSNQNLFRPLIPDAQRVIRRAMLNSKDQKLAVNVAQDVLDRAGETKKSEQRQNAQVVITDSQVNLLMQAFKESEEG